MFVSAHFCCVGLSSLVVRDKQQVAPFLQLLPLNPNKDNQKHKEKSFIVSSVAASQMFC